MFRENQNTRFVFNNFFFYEIRAVFEIMWKSIVEPVRSQMAIWSMRTECWIIKATNTHSEYVIVNCFSTAKKVAGTRLKCYIMHIVYLYLSN